ncbi:hypothetical protein [Winogradskyella helgolandensis]|uniref:hypothetical protein n=1 Tax=Winogradskyella helgolandensis TaxID=2697010 RepID=UPI0015BEA6D1|nr:hypothetical protein [Winogradskyella helgolandensis]
MNDITLPYHLIIPSLISMLVLAILFLKRKRIFRNTKMKWFWISVTVFFSFYLFIVGTSTYDDIYAQWNLNTFDLNKDGFFNGNEITPQQKKAMRNLISDTGRNFSFITGCVVSGTLALTVFGIGKIIEFIKKKQNTGYNQKH